MHPRYSEICFPLVNCSPTIVMSKPTKIALWSSWPAIVLSICETFCGSCTISGISGDARHGLLFVKFITHGLVTSHVLQQTPTWDEIPHHISVLRLSTKYDVIHLRRWAIETLQKWFPPTLPRFQSTYLENAFRNVAVSVAVANVARETSAWILLPSSLLRCAIHSRSSRELYDGMTQPSGLRLELSPENRRIIFTTRPLLEHACRERTLAFIFHPHSQSTGCTNSTGNCKAFRKTIYDMLTSDPDHFYDPFFPVLLPVAKLIRRKCCEACVSRWTEQNRRAVEELWEELPSILELQPWDQLQLSIDNNSEMSATALSPSKGLDS